MIYLGVDWAEAHHDLWLEDAEGRVLAKRRVSDSLEGVRELHQLVGDHVNVEEGPEQVVVGIEKDRGLLVQSLVAAGYLVYALNPLSVARYRERHVTSGAKSDPGDARVLADLVRTDRDHHRTIAGDSDAARAVQVLARAHHAAIWSERREANALRNALKDFYPGALAALPDLTHSDASAVLAAAPTPGQGARLTLAQLTSALARGGRRRNIERRAKEIQAALRAPQLHLPGELELAYGARVSAHVAVLDAYRHQIETLESTLAERFSQHPDAVILHSLPGLGNVLGARVLGEFGDDPTRYADARSRKNYAGTAPITRASGLSHVVLARHVRNDHLGDALDRWAFCALTCSPGARRYYDELRARKKTHSQALRQLANRLVGILHTCLERREAYDETIAWKHRLELTA